MRDYMDELMNAQPTIKEYKSQQCTDCAKLREDAENYREAAKIALEDRDKRVIENRKLRKENEQRKKELSRICNWKYCDDGDMYYWTTDCNEDFYLIEGGPQENHYIYCPKCGGYIIDSKALEAK